MLQLEIRTQMYIRQIQRNLVNQLVFSANSAVSATWILDEQILISVQLYNLCLYATLLWPGYNHHYQTVVPLTLITTGLDHCFGWAIFNSGSVNSCFEIFTVWQSLNQWVIIHGLPRVCRKEQLFLTYIIHYD